MITSIIDRLHLTPLAELQERTNFVSLSKVIGAVFLELRHEETQEQGEFAELEQSSKTDLTRALKHLWALIKYHVEKMGLMLNTLIFDLKNHEPEFSFIDPPSLSPHLLTEALRKIAENPTELTKYDYIGFKREELEKILGFSLLTPQEREQLNELKRRRIEKYQADITEGEQKTAKDETADQIIVTLATELAKYAPKEMIFGGKISKSKISLKCATSEMSYLFKNPKGQETYRDRIKNLPLH